MKALGTFIRWTERFLSNKQRNLTDATVRRRRQFLASVLMASLGYHAPYFIVAITLAMGFQPFGLTPWAWLYLYTLVSNAAIYILVLRVHRLSARFVYWLTILQLGAWLIMFAFAALFIGEHRSVTLIFAMMTYCFVTLIGSFREATILSSSVVVVYLVMMTIGHQGFDIPINAVKEVLYLGAFITVSLFLAFMGRSMRLSRDKARHTKKRLQIAQIELNTAMSQMKHRARTDELTGIDNRRRGREILDVMQKSVDKGEFSATLMVLDIDYFKKINDTYGHDAGDVVLKNVAAKLTNMKRDKDLLARWGGEEFLMAWPHTRLGGAHSIAERLREAVEQLGIEVEGQQMRVTFSAGLTELVPDTDIDESIRLADKFLYAAKHAGRNQIAYGRNDERGEAIDE